MTEKEFILAFKEYGWDLKTDEAGDFYGQINLKDRIIQIIPSLKKRSDHYRIAYMPSVSTDLFSTAFGKISGKAKIYTPIIRMNEVVGKVSDINLLNTQSISNNLLTWAKEQDIEKGLEVYRNLPTDAKGVMPLRHLAALAINGDLDQLVSYQDSFHQGNRLGFVPYITTMMIDQAVLIAKKYC